MAEPEPRVPRRGLRVVMLTTDEVIDRRILGEAESLIEDGYDVYVLAAPRSGRGDFEHHGRVPVERVDPVLHGTRVESIGLRAQRKPRLRSPATVGLRASRFAQRAAGRAIDRLALLRSRGGSRLLAAPVLQLPSYEIAFLRRALFYRPDVVHVHDLPLLRVGVGVKERSGARLVYDMHEFYPEQSTIPPRVRGRLRAIESAHITAADARFTVNPRLAEAISSAYGVDVGVVQNATRIPEGLHDREHDRFRAELGISRDRMILLYQGWIAPDRNLEVLVDALPHVRRPLVLVLMGYGDYAEELRARAARTGAGDRLVVVAAKSQEELLTYTASADAGVIPYPRDLDVNTLNASPNKLYEYIAARVPILANDLPFLHDVVAANGFGFVTAIDTPERAAAAIDSLTPEALTRYRENLVREASEWTWEREREQLLAVYRGLRDGG